MGTILHIFVTAEKEKKTRGRREKCELYAMVNMYLILARESPEIEGIHERRR